MISSTRRDACIHSGHNNSGCCGGGRAMPGFAPRNRVSQGGGQGTPAVPQDGAVIAVRRAPDRESKQKFGTKICPQQPCYVKGHGHAKIRSGLTGYAMRAQQKSDSQKLVSRPPTIIPCNISQQAKCEDPSPHYHLTTHVYFEDDALTLDEAGSTITKGCSDKLKVLTRSTTTLIQRIGDIKAALSALDDVDPGEVDNSEKEELDEKHEHETSDDSDERDDKPTDLPIIGDRLSRDKVTLAVREPRPAEFKNDVTTAVAPVVHPIVCPPAYKNEVFIAGEPPNDRSRLFNFWNNPGTKVHTIGGILEFYKNILNFDADQLADRIIYNTTGTGGDVYANSLLNSFILWLCGSQTDITRNAQFDKMMPEFIQYKSVDTHTVNKFLGINFDQYVSRKGGIGKKSWIKRAFGAKQINGEVQRSDVFDVVAQLGYTSFSVEKIILPLLRWLQTVEVTQSREVIGSDGKHRAYTRGQIMTACQACPETQQWRDLGDRYYDNTVDYYVQLMAVRDVHKFFRQARPTLSLKPLNEAPSAKSMCPSRGARS